MFSNYQNKVEFALPNISIYYEAVIIKPMLNVVLVQVQKNTITKECWKRAHTQERMMYERSGIANQGRLFKLYWEMSYPF